MLEARYEASSGIVTTISRGLHSQDQFDDHVRKLMLLLARSQARYGEWLHLVDASAHLVQSSDSSAHMAKVWRTNPDMGGYSAYLVGSSLAHLQIKRLREDSRAAFFNSAAKAREWLLDRVRGAVPAEA